MLFAAIGGLDRLAIDDSCAWLRISACLASETFAQGGVNPLPGPIPTPQAEVVRDGLPWRKLVRQQPPRAAAADDVDNAIEDLAQRMKPWATGCCGHREEGFEDTVFCVGKIRGVRFSCHASSIVEPTSTPFQTASREASERLAVCTAALAHSPSEYEGQCADAVAQCAAWRGYESACQKDSFGSGQRPARKLPTVSRLHVSFGIS
jgi:hypothetical protein